MESSNKKQQEGIIDVKEEAEEEEEEEEENYIDLNHAIEVEENDDSDMPMEEDDEEMSMKTDDRGDGGGDNNANATSVVPVEKDMSIQTISSHKPSSVFSVASYMNTATNVLSIVTGGGDDRAFLHKLDNTNVVSTLPLSHQHTDSVSCVATNESLVSADLTKTPKYIAVGGYDGNIVLYNPDSGEKIQVLDGPTDVEFLAFHPKGGSVLLAGSISDATVWMYHLPTAKCMQVFVGHECNGDGGGVTGGCFTPDGKFGLTIGMDGSMRIWAPRTGVCRHVFKFHQSNNDNNYNGMQQDGDEMKGLTCLAVDGGVDGQLAIAGGEDGSAHVVHLQGKKVVATLRHFEVPRGGEVGNNNNDEEDGMIMSSVEAVGFASKNVNANWVATGGSDGKLKVWDLTFDGGQCRQICEVKGGGGESVRTGGVTGLRWHPNLPMIVASYSDTAIRLWDARNGNLVHTLTSGSSSIENQINDISVEFLNSDVDSGGSLVIITGNDDGNTKVFKLDLSSVA